MKAYTNVSRKTVGEDRMAICPNFGCEYMTRVKPLKIRFLGFDKHPKCKKHHMSLVYVDERIGDFVDAALACFFDIAGLPPNELLEGVKTRFPHELEAFLKGWIYCIAVGRGAPIVSHYMDGLSNAYLKRLTKKQIWALKKGDYSKSNRVYKAIKEGMDEISIQYTRILKHMRAHSEILSEPENLKPFSTHLQKYLNEWQKNMLESNKILIISENKREMTLIEIKHSYDQILNAATSRCLIGLNPESKEIRKAKISAFDRFSAYYDFYHEGLTSKFTKHDVLTLLDRPLVRSPNQESVNKKVIKFPEGDILTINNIREKFIKFRDLEKTSHQEFLDYYIVNYDNYFSNRFRNLDLIRYKSSNIAIAEGFRSQFVKQGYVPYIVYELVDLETDYIRVGYSGGTDSQRKKWYIDRAFTNEHIPNGWGNIYHAIKECISKQEANNRFQMVIKYVSPSIGEAKVLEEFLTIYENRADNELGYDLTINNEYNKIVGSLFKSKNRDGNLKTILSGEYSHNWKDVPPIYLAEAVLDGLGIQEISDLFKISPKTVRRRFKAYRYGVREVYDLKDARAFLLKPYIIEGFKKGLTQEEFFDYCESEGIKIFNKFEFKKDKPNYRGAFFRRMLNQIWGTSKHKEARYRVIADYILSIITRLDVTPGEAEIELKKIISFKYNLEFARICRDVFGMDFRSKRDEIFKPRIENLVLKYKDERNLRLKIAIELGLCTINDDTKFKERASSWIKNYVRSNYGVSVSQLSNILVNKKL